MGLTAFEEHYPLNNTIELFNAQGTTALPVSLNPGGAARIDQIWVANNDAIAHVVHLLLTKGATDGDLGSVSIPAGQGYAGTPSIEVLNAILGVLNQGFCVDFIEFLSLSVEVPMIGLTKLSITVLGGRL